MGHDHACFCPFALRIVCVFILFDDNMFHFVVRMMRAMMMRVAVRGMVAVMAGSDDRGRNYTCVDAPRYSWMRVDMGTRHCSFDVSLNWNELDLGAAAAITFDHNRGDIMGVRVMAVTMGMRQGLSAGGAGKYQACDGGCEHRADHSVPPCHRPVSWAWTWLTHIRNEYRHSDVSSE